MLKVLYIVCLFAVISYSKVVYKTINFKKNNNFHYISKFGVSIGQGSYEVKVRFKKKPTQVSGRTFNLHVGFYLDTAWPLAMDETDCKEKLKPALSYNSLILRDDGSWSNIAEGALRQKTRPYVWFMAVSDCNGELISTTDTLPSIEVYVKFRGNNNTQFSHEEIGLLGLYFLAFIAYSGILGYNVYNCYMDFQKTERLDSPILILLIAVGCEFISILSIMINLWVYSYDGEGIKFLHVVGIIAEVASQFFLSILLILISWGWTITYLEFGDIEIYIPLLILLLVMHLLVAGLTQLTSDEYSKYYDYEGVQGLVLVISRLGMFAYFLYGMKDTYAKCRTKARVFLKPFAIYAGTYLVSFPVLVMICQICAHYVRHKVMTIGSIAVQSIAMCILLRLFIGKTSYTQVSKHGGTILPGGKGD